MEEARHGRPAARELLRGLLGFAHPSPCGGPGCCCFLSWGHGTASSRAGLYAEVAPQPTVPDARGAHSSTMKLLTHNLLQSPGTRHGYPLAIEAEKVETVETEFNPDFLVRMVEKLDYPGLVTTIATVCHRRCRAAPPRTHAACA